jgi:hypothetical protein
MNDELERIRKEAVVAYMKHYPSICLGETQENHEKLNQYLGRDSNRTSPDIDG